VAYDYNDNGGNVGIGTGINDPSIPQNSQSSSTFDASFGVYFSNPKYYVGLSATHLTQGGLDNLNYENARHYYLMAGYDFEISSVLNLQPNILAKTEASSFQFDGNVNLMYDNTLWVGVSYRLEDALAPQVGYQYVTDNGKNTLRAGYSYDVTTSDISNYSNGSHEIMLSYCFKIEKPLPKRVYKNVRFL
jgi:type IX secretion system PorP/SprF family membrane protein